MTVPHLLYPSSLLLLRLPQLPKSPHLLDQAYKHYGGQNNARVAGVIPTDPNYGYSHFHLNQFNGFTQSSVDAVRFYVSSIGKLTTRRLRCILDSAMLTARFEYTASFTLPLDLGNCWKKHLFNESSASRV